MAVPDRTTRRLTPGTRVLLDAHNAYRGWRTLQRSARAGPVDWDCRSPSSRISSGIAIRALASGRSVVSHGAPLSGSEPSLDEYFFQRSARLIEQALRENRRETWPVDHAQSRLQDERAGALTRPCGRCSGKLRVVADDRPSRREGRRDCGPRAWAAARAHRRGRRAGRMCSMTQFQWADGFVCSVPCIRDSAKRLQAGRGARASRPRIAGSVLRDRASNYRRWWNHPWSVVELRRSEANAGEWTAVTIEQRLHSSGGSWLIETACGFGSTH